MIPEIGQNRSLIKSVYNVQENICVLTYDEVSEQLLRARYLERFREISWLGCSRGFSVGAIETELMLTSGFPDLKQSREMALSQLFSNGARTALLIGFPRIGKSSLCQKVVYDWAQGNLWQKYKAVYWLSFSPDSSWEPFDHSDPMAWLAEVIASEIFQEKTLANTIKQQLETDDEQILIVWDSSNQTSPTVASIMNLLLACSKLSCLITSNPTKDLPEADVVVEIKGLPEPQKKDYIHRFFLREISQDNGAAISLATEKAQSLFTELASSCFAGSIGNPSFLHMLCLFREAYPNRELPETVTHFYQVMVEDLLRRSSLKTDEAAFLRCLGIVSLKAISNQKQFLSTGLIEKTLEEFSFSNLKLEHFVSSDFFKKDTGSTLNFLFPNLQEYFIAYYISSRTVDALQHFIEENHANPDFRQVFVFLLGLSSHSCDAQRLLRTLASCQGVSPTLYSGFFESLKECCFHECPKYRETVSWESLFDLVAHHESCFYEAYSAGNAPKQVTNLEKLAALLLIDKKNIKATNQKTDNNYILAANQLNGALHVAVQNQLQESQKRLYASLERLEEKFILRCLKIKLPHSHQAKIELWRQRLAQIRNNAQKNLDANRSIVTIQATLNSELKQLLVNIIQDSIAILGNAPGPFAIISLGSMSRNEMSPYSDVEFAFLIKNPSQTHKKYFRRLARLIRLRILNLGETHSPLIKPLRCEDGKSLTSNGFCVDTGGLDPLGMPNLYELIGTPHELASFQAQNSLLNKDDGGGTVILLNAMARVSKLMGDGALVSQYRKYVRNELNKKDEGSPELCCRQQRALKLIKGHLEQYHPRLNEELLTGAARAFDAKTNLYRPLQILIESLALYYQLKSSTTMELIDELKKKGIFSNQGAIRLKSALATALTWRFKVQLFYGSEKESMVLSETDEDQGYFSIGFQETIKLREIYRTQFPFQQAVENFQKQNDEKFLHADFYDPKVGQVNYAVERSLNYTEAERQYVQAASFSVNPSTLGNLGRIKRTLGQAIEAVDYEKRRLALLKKSHGDTPHEELADCLGQLGHAYQDLGYFQLSLDYFHQSYNIFSILYQGAPKRTVVRCLHGLSTTYFQLDKWQEALQYQQQCKAIVEQLPEDDRFRELIVILDSIAVSQQLLGRLDEALASSLQALQLAQEKLDKASLPTVANLWNNLGFIYSSRSLREECLEALKKSLDIKREIFSTEAHPEMAVTLSNIGDAYCKFGLFQEAIDVQTQALNMYKKIYEKTGSHPGIARSLNNLAFTLRIWGHLDEAREMYLQALEMYKRVYKSDVHSNIAKVLGNLGTTYQTLGQWQSALNYFQQSLEMYLHPKVYGNHPHPSVGMAFNNLGGLLKELGELQKAENHFRQAEVILVNAYQVDNHPDIITCRNNLLLLRAKMDPDAAIEGYKQSLERLKEVYGNQPHPEIALCLNNLAVGYKDAGQLDKAIELYHSSLDMKRKIYGKQVEHESIALALNNLGLAYHQCKQTERALGYLKECLQIQEAIFGRETPHPSLANTLQNLGALCLADNQLNEGQVYLERAIIMFKQLNSGQTFQWAACLWDLGTISEKKNDLKIAVFYFNQSIQMRQKLHENISNRDVASHQGTAVYLTLLSMTYGRADKLEEAIACSLEALEICKQLYGNCPDRNMANCMSNLGEFYRRMGQQEQANQYFQQAREIKKRLSDA